MMSPSWTQLFVSSTAGLLAFWVGSPHLSQASDLDRAIDLVLRLNEAAAQSQQRIDKLDDQKSGLLSEYRSTQQRIETMERYKAQVLQLVEAQRTQLADLRRQIDEAVNIGREITPLMLRMLDVLDKFVELDVPFLLKERKDRVARLRKMMERPDVTEAEKFRRILEAYQIENEFGRTIESYQGPLAGSAEDKTVNFLRVGRVSLVYQSLDGREIGAWNQQERKWEPLSSSYRNTIKKGISIAKRRAPPNLIFLPVPAPTAAEATSATSDQGNSTEGN